MLKQLEKSYAVRDKQDVLAMCALQFAAKAEQKIIDTSVDLSETLEHIEVLNKLLDTHLS
jgi:cell division protein ZapA